MRLSLKNIIATNQFNPGWDYRFTGASAANE
jgi:hypothetical protein